MPPEDGPGPLFARPASPAPAAKKASRRTRATQADRTWLLLVSGCELTGLSAARDHGILNLASRIADLLKQGRPIKKRSVIEDRPGGGTAKTTLYYLAPEDRAPEAP
ncbi:MAG: helix-turn-helix domain-containing protein [Planctomycetes bacterium]|nr:helix-turn-helix domain-containing protein [Planctomycetota bacterium]